MARGGGGSVTAVTPRAALGFVLDFVRLEGMSLVNHSVQTGLR